LQTAGQFPACPKGQKIPIVLNYYTKDNGVIQGEERAKPLFLPPKPQPKKKRDLLLQIPFFGFITASENLPNEDPSRRTPAQKHPCGDSLSRLP
jgi:hypothetical protein